MKRISPLLFLGILLVFLVAVYALCLKLPFLLPECQACLDIRHIICPTWWVMP